MKFPWFLKRQRELDLDDEIRSHIEEAIDDRIARGELPGAARRNVLREFGNVGLVKEVTREMWGWASLERLMQDLRFGWRMLLKNKTFTIVAVMSLALGIGANTAIFSLMDAVLLRTLPVAHPEQLYFINNVGARGGSGAPPYPCFERFRDQNTSFTGLAAFARRDVRMRIDGEREEIEAQFVSGNYFSLLGVNPVLGRVLTAADDTVPGKGGPDGFVGVLSHNFWTRRFGRSPEVIGKVVQIGADSVTIVGVSEPGFYGLSPGSEVDISVPLTFEGPTTLASKRTWWLKAIGRLKPGVSVDKAQAELDAVFQPFMTEAGISASLRRDSLARIELTPAGKGLDTVRRQFSRPLQALMAMVALVLLIACANVANLLLARGASRRREFGIRLAIGAGRWRLMRQLLTENLLLVSFGGAIGLGLAYLSGSFLKAFFATGSDRLLLDIQLNVRVLLFAIGVALLTALMFGLAPAWQAMKIEPSPALKETSTGNTRRRTSFGKALVVIQVVLSVPLLVGAGLFLQTMRNLGRVEAGFAREGVVTMRINPSAALYRDERLASLWQDILARVTRLPGVASASLSSITPFGGVDTLKTVEVSGFVPSIDKDQHVRVNQVSEGFFDTLGVGLVRGRVFTANDREGALRVALLNETAARFYFGNRDPLGAQLRFDKGVKGTPEVHEVVGIVKDSRYSSLREPDTRAIYLPMRQSIDQMGRLALTVRGGSAAASLIGAIRSEIRAAGSDILLTQVATLEDQVNQSLLQERLLVGLSTFFGLLALLLTCTGLYGVMSYDVARRTQEIGIRIALGADVAGVIRLILRQSLPCVALGLSVGLVIAMATTRWVEGLLFGLSANDPLTIALAVGLLTTVATGAGCLPARRAARVNPLTALRRD